MLEKNNNPVRKALKEGKKLSGGWLQAASPITAEVMAEAGFDVLMVDMEHGPGNIMTTMSQVARLKGEKAVPFARATWNDFVLIKRILDSGVWGLLVPYVNSKEEAEMAVKAIQYPTEGVRGVAGSPRVTHYGNNSMDYMKTANDNIFLMTTVETMTAVKNLDEILTVDRLDGIFLGPMDLATSMGHFGSPSDPEVQEVIRGVEKKVFASGKIMATVAGSFEDAKAKYERGYSLVFFCSDTTSLSKFARNLVGEFNKYNKTN